MIYNKEINGVKFTLVCEAWSTPNSWGHKVTLYQNNTEQIGSARVRYYNRTWEKYRYQSTIQSVIWDVIQAIKKRAKAAFLKLHNYKVLTKKRAAEFAEYLKTDQDYNMYNELYRMF